MQFQKSNWFVPLSSFLLVLLFAYTGISKLLNYELFRDQLLQNSYLKSFAVILSFSIPILEILIAVFLVFERTYYAGMYGAVTLLTVFTVYVALMLLQNKAPLHCTCGGVISAMTWRQHLWFNIVFTGITWSALFAKKKMSKNISTNKKEVS